MRMEILLIPMGNKAKGIIKGKVFCTDQNSFLPKTFMTSQWHIGRIFGTEFGRKFFSKGRPVRKVIDSKELFAPYHLHDCDRIV